MATGRTPNRPRREIRRNPQTIFHAGDPVRIPDDLSPDNLAPEEGALIHGSVVDLSNASKFCRERAEIALQLSEHVTCVGTEKYELSARIHRDFLVKRYCGVGNEHSAPADRLATALYWCAKLLAFELGFRTRPDKLDAWTDYLDAIGSPRRGHLRPRAFVRVPVSSDGQIREPWSHPDLAQLSIHFAFNTEIARMRIAGKDAGSIQIADEAAPTATLNGDGAGQEFEVERLPELTIKLEGSPVAKMMVASLGKGADAKTVAQQFTITLLSGVVHELKRFLGISSKRGRPRLGIGEQAALLLDHYQVNITQAVAQICPSRLVPSHRHDKRCQDRVRLAARQYYKSLKREFGRYLPPKAKNN
jgi:hypothetical protein